jgi:O-antigen ligase
MASNRALAPVRSGLPQPAAGTARRVATGPLSWLIIWAFVAFVSSMPFEAALLLGGEGLFSISRLLGYMFFGLALLQPRMCFRKPPRALWWFALYLGLYVLTGLYQPSIYWPEISSTLFRLTQFLVLLWVAYNLLQHERVARWCLWGFGLACVAVAGLLAGGVGVSEYRGVAGRQTVFGQGPNSIASLIGLGAVALIGLAYGRVGARQKTKLAAWAGFLIVAAAVTRTGSRGALVGLGMGLMTLLASRGSARTRIRNALIVVLALGACVWITITSATAASRWQNTLEEGSMAGRQRIYREAFRMFEERPIRGWGPATNYYALGRRLNLPKRDTHNMFLWLLTEQGLVGTIPFCIGLAMCARAAWRGRKGVQGPLPLALLVAVLTVNLSGTYYVTKWFWLILAYALASATYVRRRRPQSRLMSANRPGLGLTRSSTAASHSSRRSGVVSRPGAF